MTLQAALANVLLVGLPMLLLALGVLAHAYYVARPRADARNDRLIEGLIAESVDQLIAQLRVEPPRRAPQVPMTLQAALQAAPGAHPSRPSHAFAALSAVPDATPPIMSAPNLRMAVTQLFTEGLSDRSIARRLGIGIEEVRAARISGTGGVA